MSSQLQALGQSLLAVQAICCGTHIFSVPSHNVGSQSVPGAQSGAAQSTGASTQSKWAGQSALVAQLKVVCRQVRFDGSGVSQPELPPGSDQQATSSSMQRMKLGQSASVLHEIGFVSQ